MSEETRPCPFATAVLIDSNEWSVQHPKRKEVADWAILVGYWAPFIEEAETNKGYGSARSKAA